MVDADTDLDSDFLCRFLEEINSIETAGRDAAAVVFAVGMAFRRFCSSQSSIASWLALALGSFRHATGQN